MLILKVIYVLNIVVAGFVGVTALFFPRFSSDRVFQGTIAPNWSQRIVGCLWLGIALLSVLGWFKPLVYSPVLLLQLLYKGSWLMFIALPMSFNGKLQDLPTGMTFFFLIWVIGLLLFLPYAYLFPF
ncbi:hypothetical protein [Vampirovibrio sp.]|uniref:hypothetical protein n=1 Tax=Vampirovibrio sp. TaxID=2717857 RepID=UPI003592FDAE